MLTMDHPVVEAFVEGDDAMQQQQHHLVGERGQRIKAAVELALARSSQGRHWGRALGRRALVLPTKDAAAVPTPRQPQVMKSQATTTSLEAARGGDEDDDQEEVVVEEKVALLRQLVPGGEDMEVDGLLEETADYIAALKQQVGVMRALACMLSGAGIDALPEKATTDGHVIIAPEK
ncbi:hypothetical protein PR202_gb05450 [Eleusine coracana subsp. coracana]|uniref:BHLH domain-containing protein n=1 Tax=Eleusine coracana subsp. coracana TaxID=191504 RepID=A0AAV5E6C8_ELECO|nr:hypothetical protein QOZ80_1BG0076080 [Eleusine coracana subsp. coracana]GJN18303.1 hypothetical protein PR202_gb05450 [Eleusine coracana subsp. coracana]